MKGQLAAPSVSLVFSPQFQASKIRVVVQEQDRAGLNDLAEALAYDGLIVAHHKVVEVLAEGFALGLCQFQAELVQALWSRVWQLKGLGQGVL